MMEYDTQQGGLIHSLQINTLIATVVLEIFVILFSLLFARIYTNRLRQIMSSIRIVREGDYSHTLKMRGNDELRILSDEFNDLIIRLQNSEEKRRQFVSDASHELKTPLASIKLLSDSILQNDMDMETIREFVQDIGNEADRLNRMSQKLLSLSRVESQSDSEYEIVYLAPTVKKVIRMLHEIARRSSISIQAELDGDCSILIIEDDLYQSFSILLRTELNTTPPADLCLSTCKRIWKMLFSQSLIPVSASLLNPWRTFLNAFIAWIKPDPENQAAADLAFLSSKAWLREMAAQSMSKVF